MSTKYPNNFQIKKVITTSVVTESGDCLLLRWLHSFPCRVPTIRMLRHDLQVLINSNDMISDSVEFMSHPTDHA